METKENETQSGEPISNVTTPNQTHLEDLQPVELGEKISYIALEDILFDESTNIRRFAPPAKDIKELAEDMAKSGQTTPVLVRKVGKKAGGFQLIDGFQRYKAAAYINENKLTAEPVTLAAIVVDMSDAQAFSTAVSTFKRYDLSPIDLGNIIVSMQDEFGFTKKEIAKKLGRVASQITEFSQFMTLRPKIQKRLHEGSLPINVGVTLCGIEEEKDQDSAIEAYDKTGHRDSVRQVKRNQKGKKGKGNREQSQYLSPKEMREGFASLAGAIKYPEGYECPYTKEVQQLFKLIIKFTEGKINEQPLGTQIAKIIEG